MLTLGPEQRLIIDEFAALFDTFDVLKKASHIVVAVSGGADSLALTLLLQEWAQKNHKSLTALTVDHQLRPESQSEAQQVHQWLTSRQIPHHTLTWESNNPSSRIQEKARDARYTLLKEWCYAHNANVLVTAHHAMDQVETFMMRLTRGSGLKGLCCMRPMTQWPDLVLLRPFLEIWPEKLHHVLQLLNQPYVNDPSNQNLKFERIRWRQTIQNREEIFTTIHRLQVSQSMVDHQLQQIAQSVLKWTSSGEIILNESQLRRYDFATWLLFFSELFRVFNAKGYAPKYPAIVRFCQKLFDNQQRVLTLGGALIRYRKNQIIISREKRAQQKPLILSKGTHHIWWDRRFWVKINVSESQYVLDQATAETYPIQWPESPLFHFS